MDLNEAALLAFCESVEVCLLKRGKSCTRFEDLMINGSIARTIQRRYKAAHIAPHDRPEQWGRGVAVLWVWGEAMPHYFAHMLHEENWEIVSEIYAGRPGAALDLAAHLMDIRKALQRGSKGKEEAIEAIDLAIAELYNLA